MAVTQSATSRFATSRLPTASYSSAELDRASRVGDKIKCRLATNVNASVPPFTSTTTTDTTAGVSLQAPPNKRPTPDEASSSPLSASSTPVASLTSLLPEDVHDLPPASTSISIDPLSDDNDGFTLVTKGKKSRSRKITEASGKRHTSEQLANPAPRTTKPAVGVAHPQPLPNAYPAFRVPAQEGYATSYDAVTALEEEYSHLNLKNVIGRDDSSVLLSKDEYTYLTQDAQTSVSAPALKQIKFDPKT